MSRPVYRGGGTASVTTDHDIPVCAGTAEIAPGLLLHKSSADTLVDTSPVIVQITVDNLPAAARRLSLDTTTTNLGYSRQACDHEFSGCRDEERCP
jgi:hypothetical protein